MADQHASEPSVGRPAPLASRRHQRRAATLMADAVAFTLQRIEARAA